MVLLTSNNIPHFKIWKLSQMVIPGNRSNTGSPKSPLDLNFPSPGSWKRCGDSGGVGLGIVAALEKKNREEISVKRSGFCYSDSNSNSHRSDLARCSGRFKFEIKIDLSEEYTCVTNRDGSTKVYYNDDGFEIRKNRSDDDNRHRIRRKPMEIVEESPARKREIGISESPDFLNWCCLCKKKLQGKDIYIYKGDEGFCSVECRSVKIMEDDFREQYKPRNVKVTPENRIFTPEYSLSVGNSY